MPAAPPPLTPGAQTALSALGASLREQRRAHKISATSAAESAGMSRMTWHRIEKGEPSVTAGAYAAAVQALGLQLHLQHPGESADKASRKGWLPARIVLANYPELKTLAWQVHTDSLTPREAWDIYERNARHLDTAEMSPAERDLIDALREAVGQAGGL